jgi:hypothetical protein
MKRQRRYQGILCCKRLQGCETFCPKLNASRAVGYTATLASVEAVGVTGDIQTAGHLVRRENQAFFTYLEIKYLRRLPGSKPVSPRHICGAASLGVAGFRHGDPNFDESLASELVHLNAGGFGRIQKDECGGVAYRSVLISATSLARGTISTLEQSCDASAARTARTVAYCPIAATRTANHLLRSVSQTPVHHL